ncbi:restriction endonuclease subunit S [Mucilaginibacter pedocola]|uniref:Type I restriction modification DNA specificity domain-containing protein n=1 Tax=Mucilaginibacter pedocola TaxID=1792845 RepID=A0A1S9PF82_9SPHI|nr:restriction endonuclease subunit S [Mucilaginibacter pedocola]OOQ59610.1 hypothetical protein BC343_05450 [Mucilaginibacter pedocola]
MNWKPSTFDKAVESNPKVFVKKGEFVENCEMEDIEPTYRFLYPREGKIYNGSNSKFQNGDTVFARITPCLENGKIAQIKNLKNNKGIGSTEFLVFRGRNGVSDSDFVYYLCKSDFIRDTAVNSMSGASGRQRADLKAIKNIKLLLPSLIEQRQIAAVLSSYDDLIEVNNKRMKLLEETARELYKEWFVRMRFPGYKSTRYESLLPEAWCVGSCYSFADVKGGGTPVTTNPAYWTGEISFFTPTDHCDSFYIMETEKKITEKGLKESSTKLFPKNSTFITARGTVGNICLAGEEMAMNQSCFGIISHRPDDRFFTFLFTDSMVTYLKQVANGATFDAITLNTFKNYKATIPNKELRSHFHSFVSPMFNQIEILIQQNSELRKIRDRLLPRLISGKLKVKIAEETPCL